MNVICKIAQDDGRDCVTPEDVQEAINQHENDPHLIRIDLLEILGKQTEFGWEDPSLCAYIAWKGNVEK